MKKRIWIGVPERDAEGRPAGQKYWNYIRAVRAAGGVPCWTGMGGADYAVSVFHGGGADGGTSINHLIRPEDCAALLLPGGGDLDPALYGQPNTASRNVEPDRDALERDLLERFLRAGKPILGVCRGMQSVNVFFGGTLLQDIPGHGQTDGRDRLHAVRTASGPFRDIFQSAGEPEALFSMSGGGQDTSRSADEPEAAYALTVNSAHHQAADRLGDGLAAEQWTADGVVEAVRHRTLPVWGVQWHPERLDSPAGAALFRAFLDL